MKPGTIISLFLISTIFCSASDRSLEKPFYDTDRPLRSIRIGGKDAFVLKEGHPEAAEIVVEADAPFLAQYAAQELQKYLEQSIGTKFPIVNEPSKKNDVSSFFIGMGKGARQAGIGPENFCRDSFVIKTSGKNIYICGRDDAKLNEYHFLQGGVWDRMNEKGTLFGVYDFLERFVGVRFYYPLKLFIIVPKHRELKIPETDIFERPDFEFRRVSMYKGFCEDSTPKAKLFQDDISPMKNQYYTFLRLQTRYIPNNHGLAMLGYIDRFGKNHPEYFALLSDGTRSNSYGKYFPGQFCYSNPGLFEEIYKDGVALLTGRSAASRGVISNYNKKPIWNPAGYQTPTAERPGIFGLMPMDGFQPCRCPECSKHFSKGLQETSNFVWSKMAGVARRLKENHIPGYVSLMAYYPYHLVPEVDIPDNMLVMLAAKGPWQASPALQEKDAELIRAWSKKVGYKVWLWNYLCKFGKLEMPDVPSSSPNAVGDYYKSIAGDVTGAYMQSDTDRMIFNLLNYYVFAKVAWDNSSDVKRLLDEHFRLCYGKAAAPMKEFFDRMETLWMTKIGGKTVESPVGPLSVPPSENELWTQVYSPSELQRLEALLNGAEKSAASDKAALERIKYMRKAFLEPLKKKSSDYLLKNAAITGYRLPLKKDTDSSLGVTLALQPFRVQNKIVETSVRMQLTKDELTIQFNCQEPALDKVVSGAREFDDPEIWKDDDVEVFLDPAGTRKNYYHILVNSKGAFSDRSCFVAGGTSKGDFRWNSGATVTRTEKPGEWIVTIRIPRKNLPPFGRDGFVANFSRSRLIRGMPNSDSDLYSLSPFLHRGFNEIENFAFFPFAETTRNLIEDGDFSGIPVHKNRIGKWITHFDQAKLDPEKFIFAGQSLKISLDKTEAQGFKVVRQALPLKPETRYRLSYYLQMEDVRPAGKNPGVSVKIFDGKSQFYPKTFMTGSMPWSRFIFEFTTGKQVPGKKYSPFIDIHCCNAYGTFRIDGMELVEVTE